VKKLDVIWHINQQEAHLLQNWSESSLINHILRKTRLRGLHFCRWQYGSIVNSVNLMQLAPKAAVLWETTQNDGHWAVQLQGHSRSPIFVPIKSPQIIASDRDCLCLTSSFGVKRWALDSEWVKFDLTRERTDLIREDKMQIKSETKDVSRVEMDRSSARQCDYSAELRQKFGVTFTCFEHAAHYNLKSLYFRL